MRNVIFLYNSKSFNFLYFLFKKFFISMDFTVKCSDGESLNVPHYAVNYCFFFQQIAKTQKQGFWTNTNSNITETEYGNKNEVDYSKESDHFDQSQKNT